MTNTTGAKILGLLESRAVPGWYNVTETTFYANYGMWGYAPGGTFAAKLIAELERFPVREGYTAPVMPEPQAVKAVVSERPSFTSSAPKIESRGMFRLNGEIYKVDANPRTGRLNAKRLNMDTRKYEYAKGVIFRLTEAHRLDLETVATHGLDSLWCMCCGRDLTNGESQRRGIGPICADKFGY